MVSSINPANSSFKGGDPRNHSLKSPITLRVSRVAYENFNKVFDTQKKCVWCS